MSFVIPDAHKVDLHAALDAQGWDIEVVESAANAWWMNELWLIRSRWRPVGATLYVSFLGDPEDESRPPRRVADVGVGKSPATDWHGSDVNCFPLNPNWPVQLAEIVRCVARLRDGGVA